MKKYFLLSFLVCGFPLGLAAQDSGFLDDYSRLVENPEFGFSRVYMKPGAEDYLARIDKLMIDQPSFVFSSDSKYKGVKPSDVMFVAEELRAAVIEGVQDQYPVVVEPGEGVALARWAVTNVRLDKAKRGILSYTPPGAIAHGVKKSMSDVVSKTRAFDVVLELELSDSLNDEVLIAAMMDISESGKEVKWADALAVANALGRRIACRMNNSRLDESDRQDCLEIKVDLVSEPGK